MVGLQAYGKDGVKTAPPRPKSPPSRVPASAERSRVWRRRHLAGVVAECGRVEPAMPGAARTSSPRAVAPLDRWARPGPRAGWDPPATPPPAPGEAPQLGREQ